MDTMQGLAIVLLAGFLVLGSVGLVTWVRGSLQVLRQRVTQIEAERPAIISLIRDAEGRVEGKVFRLRGNMDDVQELLPRHTGQISRLQTEVTSLGYLGERVDTLQAVTSTANDVIKAIRDDREERARPQAETVGVPAANSAVRDLLGAYQTQINSLRSQMEEMTVSGRGPEVTPEVPDKTEGAMFTSGVGMVPPPAEVNDDAPTPA